MSMDSTPQANPDLTRILATMEHHYQKQIDSFLRSKPLGGITDMELIALICNLTLNLSMKMFFSVKQFLPTTQIDYEFMRKKLVNDISKHFEGIHDYKPDNDKLPLTADQVREIMDSGFCMVTMPDGSIRKITEDQILIKKEDAKIITNGAKKELFNGGVPRAKKIILPRS